MIRLRRHTFSLALAACALVSCIPDQQGPDAGDATGGGTAQSGGGSSQTGGGASTGGGTATGGGAATGGGDDGGSTCTRVSCGTQCGTIDDGCGGTLTCTQGCECTEQNFDTACPSRPCLSLTGCVDARCTYAEISCARSDGGMAVCAAATSCSGPGCGPVCTGDAGCDDKLYACGGGVCADVEQYCDPSPAVMNGRVVYQNRCVAPPNQGCSTCGLGTQRCDAMADRFTCEPLPIPVEDAGVVECDSTVAGSTFIYLDPAHTGIEDGSRMRPFKTFAAATTAANARGARGIIIGGQVTFTEPLVISNGVSLYGGFGVSPFFVPDASKRPLWNIAALSADTTDNRLVGATARNVTVKTLVRHVEIRTANTTDNDGRNGRHNIGLFAHNAPGLELDDVIIVTGNAAPGVVGAAGASGGNGGAATGRTPGSVSCNGTAITCALPATPANQTSAQCGLGGNSNIYIAARPSGTAGNAGRASGGVNGGSLGTTVFDNSDCNLDENGVTAGGDGANGLSGQTGADGARGTRLQVMADGRITGGFGTVGVDGQPGTFAGGGGTGGSFENGCMNDPEWGYPGGGGGAPGCGGTRGTPGGPGGSSIGILAASSTGLVIHPSVRVTTGNGGAGGLGGNGGGGGMGGAGETSMTFRCASRAAHRGKCGGRGGTGGAGGRGGHAGGSAGGDSIGVYCVGSGSVSLSGATINTGSPGAGGSAATTGLRGTAGVAANDEGC